MKKHRLPRNMAYEIVHEFEEESIDRLESKSYHRDLALLLENKTLDIRDMDTFINKYSLQPYSKVMHVKKMAKKFNKPFLTDVKFSQCFYIGKIDFYNQDINGLINALALRTEYTKLILDLRGNSGGHIRNIIGLLEYLIQEPIHIELTFKRKKEWTNVSPRSPHYQAIYILVNEKTASASEILALGLMVSHSMCTIIGSKTFGKIYGQYVNYNKKYKYLVKITSFKWAIEGHGIENLWENTIKLTNEHDIYQYILNQIIDV